MKHSKYINIGPVADSVPYDNEACSLEAETVQEAIDELCSNSIFKALTIAKCVSICDKIIFDEFDFLIDEDCNLLGSEEC